MTKTRTRTKTKTPTRRMARKRTFRCSECCTLYRYTNEDGTDNYCDTESNVDGPGKPMVCGECCACGIPDDDDTDDERTSTWDPENIEAEELWDRLQRRCDLLRRTADDLEAGTINRWHAARRIRKTANEIARAKP